MDTAIKPVPDLIQYYGMTRKRIIQGRPYLYKNLDSFNTFCLNRITVYCNLLPAHQNVFVGRHEFLLLVMFLIHF